MNWAEFCCKRNTNATKKAKRTFNVFAVKREAMDKYDPPVTLGHATVFRPISSTPRHVEEIVIEEKVDINFKETGKYPELEIKT